MGISNKIRIIRGVVAAFLMLAAASASARCTPETVTLTGMFGTVDFSVELAITPAEQGRGLMFREQMPAQSGMLFLYPNPRPVSFWMKNTLIPLDMIFIDAAGRVINVHSNAIPGDLTAIPSGGPTMAVLEINGGLSRQIGIAPGTLVRHPMLPQDIAALPCP
ncbi:DUF192 domain-containing protein [Roseobacteraceae bacterium S113]